MSPSPFRNGVQFAFDSTTLKLIESCHYKYKLRILDRWVPDRKSVHLLFGGWFAKALEHYYKYVALGRTSHEALHEVIRETLIATWVKNEDGTEGPWQSDHNLKTRENLIRSIIWYVDQFANESITVVKQSDGTPAVEYTFALPVDNGVVFAGHIDRLVDYSGDIYVMDQKTTTSTLTPRYFDQFTPDTQVSMYSFAGKVIYNTPVKGMIIDAAQIAVGFTRFERGFAHRSSAQLDEWYDDTMRHIESIQRATRDNHFRKSTTSCNLYGGCEFRGVCSRSPEVRTQFLKADFTQGEQWNPLEAR